MWCSPEVDVSGGVAVGGVGDRFECQNVVDKVALGATAIAILHVVRTR